MGGSWILKGFIHQTEESGLFLVGIGEALKDVKQGDDNIRSEVWT